jgi:2-polyprenyl-6-methoxyphenol hydroxylase-like FAD-dependent oxidoreductase
MRKIAIVGSGQAGLLTAHGLLKNNYDVTLYSDKTSSQWLHHSRPTGTPVRFGMALEYERELGLNFWDATSPKVEGALVTLARRPGKRFLSLKGLLSRPALAIDPRLQSGHWMIEFERRGGRIIHENVDVEILDEISLRNDLTIVASGRAELSRLFPRNAGRSVYSAPKRELASFIATGPPIDYNEVPFIPSRLNIIESEGEIIIYPYLHKDKGIAWCILILAKPGGILDQFKGFSDAPRGLEIAKTIVRKTVPWHAAIVDQFQLADDLAWVSGNVTPTVREPISMLPSGRFVTAVGDTLTALDPIGGQGANLGNKAARNLVACIVKQGERPFDIEWMTNTFESFYRTHGHPTISFNNLLLENMTDAGKEILLAQFGSNGKRDNHDANQLLANAVCDNFDDPAVLTACFHDVKKARQLISRVTGRHWLHSSIRGRFGVIKEQVQLRGV